MADTTSTAGKTYTIEYVVGSLLVGLILGVLVSWLWLSSASNSAQEGTVATSTKQNTTDTKGGTTSTNTKPSAVTMPSKVTSSSSLVINDQKAGLSVFIAKAEVGENNWVVIHEDRMGQPGNALGAGRFLGGATSGSIELLRGTTAGQTYHGLIYKDDGDHIFSMERDMPLRDASGNPVVVTFKTN